MGWEFTVLEHEGDLFHLVARGPRGTIEVITTIRREGDRLVLGGFGILGAGPGTLGVSGLREIARALGRQYSVSEVVVHGGPRGSGARPGHIPRPIRIKVAEKRDDD
jgi:hypothetical protein